MNKSQLNPVGADKRSHNLQSIIQTSIPAPLPEHQLHKLYKTIKLLRSDAGPNVSIFASGQTVRGNTGFRSIRASHGISAGTFYYEVFWHPTPALPGQSASALPSSGATSLDTIQIPHIVPVVNSLLYPNHNSQLPTEAMVRLDNIPGAARLTTDPSTIQSQSPHLRVGFSRTGVDNSFPVGHDEQSFAYRDVNGAKVCNSISESYGHSFAQGDVIGCLIHIPSTIQTIDMNSLVEKHSHYAPINSRLHPTVYSGDNYDPHTNPIHPYQESPVIQELTDEISRHQWNISHLQPKTGSFIEFFKNGVPQGIAFTQLPADHFFPQISLFMHSTVTCNFGPDFAFPPLKYCSTQQVSVPLSIPDSISPTSIFRQIIAIDAQYRVIYTPYMQYFTSRSKSALSKSIKLSAKEQQHRAKSKFVASRGPIVRTKNPPTKAKSQLPITSNTTPLTNSTSTTSTNTSATDIISSQPTQTSLPTTTQSHAGRPKKGTPASRAAVQTMATRGFAASRARRKLASKTSLNMTPVVEDEDLLQSVLAQCDVIKHPDHQLLSSLTILKPTQFSRTEYSRLFPFPSLTTTSFSIFISPYFNYELSLLQSSVFHRFCAAFHAKFGLPLSFPSNITEFYAPPPTKIVERIRLNSIPYLRSNYRFHDSYDDLILPIPYINNQLTQYPVEPSISTSTYVPRTRDQNIALSINPQNIPRPEYIQHILTDTNILFHLSQRFANLPDLLQAHQQYISNQFSLHSPQQPTQQFSTPNSTLALTPQQSNAIPPMPELLTLGTRLAQQYVHFLRDSRRTRHRTALHQFISARSSFLMAGTIEEILAAEKEATIFFVKKQLRKFYAEHHQLQQQSSSTVTTSTTFSPQNYSLIQLEVNRNILLQQRLQGSLSNFKVTLFNFSQLMSQTVLKQSKIYQMIINSHPNKQLGRRGRSSELYTIDTSTATKKPFMPKTNSKPPTRSKAVSTKRGGNDNNSMNDM